MSRGRKPASYKVSNNWEAIFWNSLPTYIKILNTYFDTTGIAMPEAGSVKEQNGFLYMGGDNLPYIGKYKLK